MNTELAEARDVCSRDKVHENYRNILAVLRFYRMSGKLYVLDMVANASSTAVFNRIMADVLSELDRTEPVRVDGDECCYMDECRSDTECNWYKRLGARVRDKKVCVPCPHYRRDELKRELSIFTMCMERGNLAPYDLVLYAFT